MTTADFPTIGLLGLGTAGAGIAQVFAASGRQVVALEVDQGRIERGLASIAASLDRGMERGEVTGDQKVDVLGRVSATTRAADLAGVDLVVESIVEDAEAKTRALTELVAHLDDSTPVVTTTSVLSVTELAGHLPHPGRVAGLHFFAPVPVVRTVEVVRALQTEDALVDRLVALVDELDGKTPVVVKDRPGFLLNALLMPYLNDVIQELDDGLATAEDIDVALKLGLGYRTGPFEMLDQMGLDVHLRATEAAYAATRDDRYAPPPLLRQMVAADRLGAGNGRGFLVDDLTREN